MRDCERAVYVVSENIAKDPSRLRTKAKVASAWHAHGLLRPLGTSLGAGFVELRRCLGAGARLTSRLDAE